MLINKIFETKQTAETPTNADLEAIRQYALREVKAEEVFTGRMVLANTKVDRSHERFPTSYLERFAATLPGKPVLTGHDQRSVPVGRFYDADVVQRPDGDHDLIARYYLASDSPLTKNIELGIASGVSIGAHADKRTCSVCSKDYGRCNHSAGEKYDEKTCIAEWGGDPEKVEAIEGSFVAAPCQVGAQAVARNQPPGIISKTAYLGGTIILDYGAADPAPQGDEMEIKEALEKIAALEGELAQLSTWKTENEALVEAGDKARTAALAEIQRKYSALDAEKTGQAIVKSLAKSSFDEILAADKDAQEMFDKKFPPTPNGQVKKDEAPPAPRLFDPVATNPYQRRMF